MASAVCEAISLPHEGDCFPFGYAQGRNDGSSESEDKSTDESIQKVTEFHGHLCAGLTMGVRAAQIALREIGAHSADEEVVAIIETDM